jgi:hypothetical protein
LFIIQIMTQDSPQPTEVKKPNLCEPCAGIQQNWRRAPGHAELIQGVNRKAERSHGQATITRYRCERCGTAWEYENNKVNLHAGWSVVAEVGR